MTIDLQGQRLHALLDDNGTVLSSEVNHVVGMAPTLLVRPEGRRELVVMADKGGWRMALGDRTAAMPGNELPPLSVTDGSGAAYLADGERLRLSGPARVTVRAYTADSVLTYWWL